MTSLAGFEGSTAPDGIDPVSCIPEVSVFLADHAPKICRGGGEHSVRANVAEIRLLFL